MWEEVERHTAKLNTEEAAAKKEQDTEEAEEDPDVEIPDKKSLDTNTTEMTTRPSELKAGLPEDLNRWILSLQAYFEMNSSVYNNKVKLLTALNKISKGRGKPFSEGWFYKLNDATIPDSKKTWNKMVASFKTTFYPFDIQNKARRPMNCLVQNLRDHEEGFQKYVTDFQLAVAQTGIKDKETLIEAFATGLDPSLGQMVLSVKDIPTMLNE